MGSVPCKDLAFLLQFWKEKVPTLVLTSSSKLCCCHFKPHSNLANWSYGHYPGLEGLQYLCIDSTRKPPVSCPSPCPLPSSSFVLKSETADCDLCPPPDLLKLPLPPEFLQPIIEYVDFMKKELTGALQQMKILEQKVMTLCKKLQSLSEAVTLPAASSFLFLLFLSPEDMIFCTVCQLLPSSVPLVNQKSVSHKAASFCPFHWHLSLLQLSV